MAIRKEKEISENKLEEIKQWISEQSSRIGYNLFDDTLKYNLYFVREDLENKWDHFMVIDGKEGTGKSTLAMNIASYIDPSFEIKRVNLTAKDFIEDLDRVNKQAIILDEAGTQLYSREAMMKMNILLNKLFMVSRHKNLLIILCIPSFFMLDSYVRDHRVNSLIHLVARGHYIFYNEERAKSLSINGGKYKNHNAVHGNYAGYCNIKLAPNIKEEDYLVKKNQYIATFIQDLNKERQKDVKKPDGESTEIKIEPYLYNFNKAALLLGLDASTLRHKALEGKIPAKKMYGKWYLTKEFVQSTIKDISTIDKNSALATTH